MIHFSFRRGQREKAKKKTRCTLAGCGSPDPVLGAISRGRSCGRDGSVAVDHTLTRHRDRSIEFVSPPFLPSCSSLAFNQCFFIVPSSSFGSFFLDFPSPSVPVLLTLGTFTSWPRLDFRGSVRVRHSMNQFHQVKIWHQISRDLEARESNHECCTSSSRPHLVNIGGVSLGDT